MGPLITQVRNFTTFGAVLFLWQLGCSSGWAQESGDAGIGIRQFWTESLRVRRPEGAPADPKVGPGGIDYQSNPLPDDHLDCKKIDGLFERLPVEAIRKCLNSLKRPGKASPTEVKYELIEDVQPTLKLVVEKDRTPECLLKTLPEIPVPREIFFQSPELESYCGSSRLPIERGKWLGISLPTKKYQLHIKLSQEIPSDLHRLLAAWSLTPYYWISDSPEQFLVKEVPKSICLQCLATREDLKKSRMPRPLWPNPSLNR